MDSGVDFPSPPSPTRSSASLVSCSLSVSDDWRCCRPGEYPRTVDTPTGITTNGNAPPPGSSRVRTQELGGGVTKKAVAQRERK